MSTNQDNRVLNRMGARELTQAELDHISGGFLLTLLSVIFTHSATGSIDDRLDS